MAFWVISEIKHFNWKRDDVEALSDLHTKMSNARAVARDTYKLSPARVYLV